MKFLVERCAGLATARWLNRQGHDAFAAHHLPPSTPDTALLQLAASTGRILITSDRDFGRLIHHLLLPHAGLINLPATNSQRKINLLQHALTSHLHHIKSGDTITISHHGRIRTTPPPTPPIHTQP